MIIGFKIERSMINMDRQRSLTDSIFLRKLSDFLNNDSHHHLLRAHSGTDLVWGLSEYYHHSIQQRWGWTQWEVN